MKWQLLHNACWEGNSKEVARLLDAGANPNQIAPTNWHQTPLGRTLEFRISSPKHQGHVETVGILLSKGADPTLRSTSLDMTPYELAAFCGLQPAVDMLKKFQAKAAPHPTGMTDLWLAAASRLPEPDKLKTIKLQLSNRHHVNTVWRSATPLMIATAHAAHFHVADQLITAGANPNEGTSILHASCTWHLQHLIPAIRYLANVGWNVNAQDASGQTALHKAAFLGYASAVRTLLDLSADPMLNDSSGLAPIDLARRWHKAGVAKILARAT